MKKKNTSWLKERIVETEQYIQNQVYKTDAMQKRDQEFLTSLKQFNLLPEVQQIKSKPLIQKAIDRHKEITRNRKVCNYYSSKYDLSFGIKNKQEKA